MTTPQIASSPINSAPNAGLILSFKSLYAFSGNALSSVTDYKEWITTDQENQLLAEQSDAIIIELFPSITGKFAKILIFIVSLVGVFGTRWIKYESQKVKEKRKEFKDGEKLKEEGKEVQQELNFPEPIKPRIQTSIPFTLDNV